MSEGGEKVGGRESLAAAYGAVEVLLRKHEIAVLSTMGLLIGYVIFFMSQILSIKSMHASIIGVALLTMFLLLLGNNVQSLKLQWWARSIVVVIISLVLTGPQLFYAWNMTTQEEQVSAQRQLIKELEIAAERDIKPTVTSDLGHLSENVVDADNPKPIVSKKKSYDCQSVTKNDKGTCTYQTCGETDETILSVEDIVADESNGVATIHVNFDKGSNCITTTTLVENAIEKCQTFPVPTLSNPSNKSTVCGVVPIIVHYVVKYRSRTWLAPVR